MSVCRVMVGLPCRGSVVSVVVLGIVCGCGVGGYGEGRVDVSNAVGGVVN